MQTCIHQSECVLYEMKVSGIVIAVCAECKDEIERRITTPPEILPETPIEHYARKGKMPPTACTYKTKNRFMQPITTICGKVCDDGQKLCPRHIVVVKAEADAIVQKEEKARLKREANHKARLRAGARR